MSTFTRVALAPNFHLDSPADRLLFNDGPGWRSLTEAERAELIAQQLSPQECDGRVLLFAIPARLRAACWKFLEADAANADFDAIARDIGAFLNFKQLPPPEQARFELVLHGPSGRIEPTGLWAIVNLGDDPVTLRFLRLKVSLHSGEGSRTPHGHFEEIMPPGEETPALLLLIRRPASRAA